MEFASSNFVSKIVSKEPPGKAALFCSVTIKVLNFCTSHSRYGAAGQPQIDSPDSLKPEEALNKSKTIVTKRDTQYRGLTAVRWFSGIPWYSCFDTWGMVFLENRMDLTCPAGVTYDRLSDFSDEIQFHAGKVRPA
jgi:hypothetical protein